MNSRYLSWWRGMGALLFRTGLLTHLVHGDRHLRSSKGWPPFQHSVDTRRKPENLPDSTRLVKGVNAFTLNKNAYVSKFSFQLNSIQHSAWLNPVSAALQPGSKQRWPTTPPERNDSAVPTPLRFTFFIQSSQQDRARSNRFGKGCHLQET